MAISTKALLLALISVVVSPLLVWIEFVALLFADMVTYEPQNPLWVKVAVAIALGLGKSVVDGSAAAADQGGPMAVLKTMFSGLSPQAYAGAMEKSQVTPAALGAGYLVFFLYSAALGVAGVVLAFMVAARQPPKAE